jgi:hypothetical protein
MEGSDPWELECDLETRLPKAPQEFAQQAQAPAPRGRRFRPEGYNTVAPSHPDEVGVFRRLREQLDTVTVDRDETIEVLDLALSWQLNNQTSFVKGLTRKNQRLFTVQSQYIIVLIKWVDRAAAVYEKTHPYYAERLREKKRDLMLAVDANTLVQPRHTPYYRW